MTTKRALKGGGKVFLPDKGACEGTAKVGTRPSKTLRPTSKRGLWHLSNVLGAARQATWLGEEARPGRERAVVPGETCTELGGDPPHKGVAD
mmetsp:Transcript_107587/g.286316  ORF Transcript_107587/g.286316 Transcript_107587/m.286316 type:complete len:92 (-) Transcript_107587:295-570(-)